MNSAKTSAINNVDNFQNSVSVAKTGYSFYQKIFFLYFLNLIDWLCTEALLASGRFIEANPFMQPILNNFWQTVLIKGALPLALVLVCCLIFKLAGSEESFTSNLLLYIGIGAYALVNLWHILNFVLLFLSL